ncbi:ubiquitin carboxyl-terminal hydrolase family protein, partial [Trifolium pratense]
MILLECEHDYIAKEVSCGFRYFMSLTDLRNPQKGFIVKDACIVGAEVFVSNSNRKKQENQEVKLTASPVSNEPTKKVDAELGYTALGRVIILLQTSKVKDMNEQACKELQVLWDELKKFKFDLTWIEPQVQCALGMKRYVEKALQVEKLKEDMVVLKEKLSAAELNLDIERDLLKAEGIKERDLDSEFGSW